MYNQSNESPAGGVRVVVTVFFIGTFLFLWQYFVEAPRLEKLQKQQEEQVVEKNKHSIESNSSPSIKKQTNNVVNNAAMENHSNRLPRVTERISNGKISAELNLRGASLDNLLFIDYKENVDNEEPLQLLYNDSNQGSGFYKINFGWFVKDEKYQQMVPNDKTLWKKEACPMCQSGEIKIVSQIKDITFSVFLHLDEKYMFHVKQIVSKKNQQYFDLVPFVKIDRIVDAKERKNDESHVGPIVFADNKLNEISYADALNGVEYVNQNNGWLALSDKYWLSAVISDDSKASNFLITSKIKDDESGMQNISLISFYDNVSKESSGNLESNFKLFTGVKDIGVLDEYRDDYNIRLFDRAIDFGWFYFMAKPVLLFLRLIFKFTHNYGLAIIVMTIVIRIALLPLAKKSYVAMSKIKKMAPKMTSLREKYKNDKVTLNRELASLYVTEGISPFATIVPLLMQIPIFFALYKVLYVALDMRHSPLYGWITDLSAPDPTSIFNLFGLLPFIVPSFLQIGLLPIILGFTMWLQQKFASTTADPVQQKIMLYMPIFFIFLFAGFPSGLIIYWIVGNIFGVIQQKIINKSLEK